ncbi:hypothetical protein ACQPZA_00785 [Pseudonocardia xinjiangensis]|uniref:hypothetical protein n=1 Tax=Pseudonocardia xinjiangensis TaxID=75289 RepID=UPI003D94AAD2
MASTISRTSRALSRTSFFLPIRDLVGLRGLLHPDPYRVGEVPDGSADTDGYVAAGVEFDSGAAEDLTELARDDRRVEAG